MHESARQHEEGDGHHGEGIDAREHALDHELGDQHPLVPQEGQGAQGQAEDDRGTQDEGDEEDAEKDEQGHGWPLPQSWRAASMVWATTQIPISPEETGITRYTQPMGISVAGANWAHSLVVRAM